MFPPSVPLPFRGSPTPRPGDEAGLEEQWTSFRFAGSGLRARREELEYLGGWWGYLRARSREKEQRRQDGWRARSGRDGLSFVHGVRGRPPHQAPTKASERWTSLSSVLAAGIAVLRGGESRIAGTQDSSRGFQGCPEAPVFHTDGETEDQRKGLSKVAQRPRGPDWLLPLTTSPTRPAERR